MLEAEGWVAIAFFIFLGVLGYYGAHRRLLSAIDRKRDLIKAELEDARRIREEAAAVLKVYRTKREEAEKEAEAIIKSAKAEADRLEMEAYERLAEMVARHRRMADEKMKQAHAQAMADVRRAAADAAVGAARRLLAGRVKGEIADKLIAEGIAEVKEKITGRAPAA
jgi:F-type H+-transporting ATPase subunit b